MNIVYLNGKYLQADEAKISVFDRGFMLGDGIYEVVPLIEGKIIDINGFWERFTRSLEQIELKIAMTKDDFIDMFIALAKKNDISQGGVYVQITRGVAAREFRFLENLEPTCMAFCFKSEIINNPLAKTGIKVASVEDIRWKRRDIKSISLLGQCKAKNDAYKQGAFEGFMVENGFVTEGVSSSAYIVKGDVIITTPLSNQILSGVRRQNIIKIAQKIGLDVQFRHFSIKEVEDADEAFISSATLLILPVIQIDKTLINGGKVGQIATRLREEYIKNIYEELKL